MLNLVQHPIKSRTYQTLKHRRVTSKYFFGSPLDFRFFNLQSAICHLQSDYPPATGGKMLRTSPSFNICSFFP